MQKNAKSKNFNSFCWMLKWFLGPSACCWMFLYAVSVVSTSGYLHSQATCRIIYIGSIFTVSWVSFHLYTDLHVQTHDNESSWENRSEPWGIGWERATAGGGAKSCAEPLQRSGETAERVGAQRMPTLPIAWTNDVVGRNHGFAFELLMPKVCAEQRCWSVLMAPSVGQKAFVGICKAARGVASNQLLRFHCFLENLRSWTCQPGQLLLLLVLFYRSSPQRVFQNEYTLAVWSVREWQLLHTRLATESMLKHGYMISDLRPCRICYSSVGACSLLRVALLAETKLSRT